MHVSYPQYIRLRNIQREVIKMDQMIRRMVRYVDAPDGDVLVIAQKIVSKAEDRYVRLADVEPSEAARELAERCDKDPRQAELILQESREVLRTRPGVVIVEHRLGYVHANAGIDRSNIPNPDDDPRVLLLPEDPDASAENLRQALQARTGVSVAVIINDSMGRAWRNGTLGLAIGVAGFTALEDHIGGEDIYGRELKVTLINRADALASAATLVMGETTEKLPLALIQGLPPETVEDDQNAAAINRPLEEDLFR